MELTQKGEMVSRLQAKAGQIGKILNNLEKYNHLVKDGERKSSEKRRSIADAKELKKSEADHVVGGSNDNSEKQKENSNENNEASKQ